jgi:hypothetical protein
MEASATFTARTSDRLRRIGRVLVDGVLPPRCLSCGEIVEQPDALCSRCWSGITFFAPPWCVLCGLPFPHPMGEDAVCGECARERPIWNQARAVLRYDKNSRRLLLGFKHGDHTHSAAAFGRWMHRAGSEVLAGAVYSCQYRCTGRGSSSVATTKQPCSPTRCMRPAGLKSPRIGWFAGGERRHKATLGRRRESATSGGPL